MAEENFSSRFTRMSARCTDFRIHKHGAKASLHEIAMPHLLLHTRNRRWTTTSMTNSPIVIQTLGVRGQNEYRKKMMKTHQIETCIDFSKFLSFLLPLFDFKLQQSCVNDAKLHERWMIVDAWFIRVNRLRIAWGFEWLLRSSYVAISSFCSEFFAESWWIVDLMRALRLCWCNVLKQSF